MGEGGNQGGEQGGLVHEWERFMANPESRNGEEGQNPSGIKGHPSFTPQQLNRLRAQILVFRHIKRSIQENPNAQLQLGLKLLSVANDAIRDEKKASEGGGGVAINGGEGATTSSAAKPVAAAAAAAAGSSRPVGQPSATKDVPSTSGKGVVAGGVQANQLAFDGKDRPAQIATMLGSAKSVVSPLFELRAMAPPGTSGQVAQTLMDGGQPSATSGPLMVRFNYDPFEILRRERTLGVASRISRRARYLDQNVLKLKQAIKESTDATETRELSRERRHTLTELRKLVLVPLQRKMRRQVEEEQLQVMAMTERKYKRFAKWSTRQLLDMKRTVEQERSNAAKALSKESVTVQRQMISSAYAERDKRQTRNKFVVRFHDRINKGSSKKKVDERQKRLDAVKTNNAEGYLELLAKEGAVGKRYEELEQFLKETEGYLTKLGGKIATIKMEQARAEAAAAAAASAAERGATDGEIEEARLKAMDGVDPEEVLGNGQAGYYSVAHSMVETISRQPSILEAGQLREYQLVGLQWLVSLYNNKLNGVLADEMGLGKTVQIIALIAYLWEIKANYGPHLIIVPNAVVGNWMYEFGQWLPRVRVTSYTGAKADRNVLFNSEILPLKMNVVVTTYEFAMKDRARLSKINWKYIVIDEAQRLKSRKSQLSRDLDRFPSQRRVLLTGTPLQNDLSELWSLLNLLLPEVFESAATFQDWFLSALNKGDGNGEEGDWLDKEKRIIVIGRLHQILEPFMLRRQVEDVEGKLPPKIAHVIKCPLSMYQACMYDWIRYTGTLRQDPWMAMMKSQNNSGRGGGQYLPVTNRVIELKKLCNHPYLTYIPNVYMEPDVATEIRTCGKLWVLDRMLIKLKLSGHRVLLFSTMKRCLDIIEHYLTHRVLDDGSKMKFCRIDGSTPLEDRNTAITEFNKPNSDTFIFLISIRAGGRGINLQTADTVVMYDPDYNPKNEEQAVARSHRIGQKREVRVFHMESVAETPFEGTGKEGETCNFDAEEDVFGEEDTWEDGHFLNRTKNYSQSIEGIIRSNIQQQKIDMADEIINAGGFDGQKTDDEKRKNLEKLLTANKEKVEYGVRSMFEINRLMARSAEEIEFFDRLDREYKWPDPPVTMSEVPSWLKFSAKEARHVLEMQENRTLGKGAAGLIIEDSVRALRLQNRAAKSTGNLQAVIEEEEPAAAAAAAAVAVVDERPLKRFKEAKFIHAHSSSDIPRGVNDAVGAAGFTVNTGAEEEEMVMSESEDWADDDDNDEVTEVRPHSFKLESLPLTRKETIEKMEMGKEKVNDKVETKRLPSLKFRFRAPAKPPSEGGETTKDNGGDAVGEKRRRED